MSKHFDISGREFDFTKDLAYGQEGEEMVRSFLSTLSGGDFEVKSDRYRNGRMVVETNQNPKGILADDGNPLWLPSGINVTTAKWWVYIYSPEGAFIVVSVPRLKRFLRANSSIYNESSKIRLGGADNPARGFLLMPDAVVDLLINPKYDEIPKEKT